MPVSVFIKCVLLGSDYDPELRNVLLMINRELTAGGRAFSQIAGEIASGRITTGHSLETSLHAVRVPLVEALRAVKQALVQGEPAP